MTGSAGKTNQLNHDRTLYSYNYAPVLASEENQKPQLQTKTKMETKEAPFLRSPEKLNSESDTSVKDDFQFAVSLQCVIMDHDEIEPQNPDSKTAQTSFSEELHRLYREFEDLQCAKNLRQIFLQNEKDRLLAQNLAQGSNQVYTPKSHKSSPASNPTVPLKNLVSSNPGSNNSSMLKDSKKEIRECVSCMEPKDNCSAMPCAHVYCLECVREIAERALTDRNYIPLRCCEQSFPIEAVQKSLTAEQFKKYTNFLGEVNVVGKGVIDPDLAKVVDENHWKLCPKCGSGIEKSHGCLHMTCLCQYQFCYHCSVKWKECKCDMFELVEMERILNERVAPNEPRRNEIRSELRRVFENFTWHQHQWKYQRGNSRCAICSWNTPQFYFYCSGCRENRCRMCRHNR